MESTLAQKIHAVAERIAEPEGLEVVEVEVLGGGKSRMLRVTIDKPAGVTLNDCEFLSQQLGTVLDVEDVVPGGSYKLEISSPGVERKLFRQKDFNRFSGEKVKMVLKEARNGRKTFEGVLHTEPSGEITVVVSPSLSITARLDEIARANLKFDWR
ncbi:MAG: ribosome maturation factor RimP [Bryobacterales bacterium]|nr:ribosome maturation factor RimP [Bryobacterales bacterium]